MEAAVAIGLAMALLGWNTGSIEVPVHSKEGPVWTEQLPSSGDMTMEQIVTMQTDKELYSGTDTLKLTLKNTGSSTVFFGYPYHVEKWQGEEWMVVPPKEEQFFIMIAIYLKPGEQWEQEIVLDGLEDGSYRIVKTVEIEGKDEKYPVYAEFGVNHKAAG